MKLRISKIVPPLGILGAILVTVALSSCGAGIDGPSSTVVMTRPEMSQITVSLGSGNSTGIVPGKTMSPITLPACQLIETDDGGNQSTVTPLYTLTGLPEWLAFDATARVVSLNGVTVVPSTAYAGIQVTYSCIDPDDQSLIDSLEFTINDIDQGGVTDGYEYLHRYVPLMNGSQYVQLNDDNVGIYRGDPASFFMPTGFMVTSVGMNPQDASDDVGDFDGDGLTNQVEIRSETNMFAYTKTPTFTETLVETSIGSPVSLTSGDFNNDGFLDVATLGRELPGKISVLRNDGDGSFSALVNTLPAETQNMWGLATGDFNNDGILDLVSIVPNLVTTPAAAYVQMGVGDGTFYPASDYQFLLGDISGGVAAVYTADFNNDGNLDFAVPITAADNIAIYLGNGLGEFAQSASSLFSSGGGDPTHLAIADFNGDGYLDMAVTNPEAEQVVILTGDGAGGYTSIGGFGIETPFDIATADFNRDGIMDLAVISQPTDLVYIYNGDGDGTFTFVESYGVGDIPFSVAPSDINGDGKIDLVILNQTPTTITLLIGSGNSTFTYLPALNRGGSSVGYVTTGDFDNDGDVDIAGSNQGGNSVSVFFSQ